MAPRNMMKRFYKRAFAVPVAGGYHIALDGKPVRTPGGETVLIANQALATALAAEWEAQGPHIELAQMGFNQLVNRAIDEVAPDPGAVVEEIAAYGGSDLLCYRAEAPPALVARQKAAWDPLLEWADARYGARLRVTSGIVPVPQAAAALAALRARVTLMDPFRLSALRASTGLGGSLIVPLALWEGRLDIASAWDVVNIDEDWQREKWGEDAQAAASRASAFAAFSHAGRMLQLLQVLESDPH